MRLVNVCDSDAVFYFVLFLLVAVGWYRSARASMYVCVFCEDMLSKLDSILRGPHIARWPVRNNVEITTQ